MRRLTISIVVRCLWKMGNRNFHLQPGIRSRMLDGEARITWRRRPCGHRDTLAERRPQSQSCARVRDAAGFVVIYRQRLQPFCTRRRNPQRRVHTFPKSIKVAVFCDSQHSGVGTAALSRRCEDSVRATHSFQLAILVFAEGGGEQQGGRFGLGAMETSNAPFYRVSHR